MKKIILFTLLFIVGVSFSQPNFMWTKQIGGKLADEAVAVMTDNTGNVVVVANIKDTLDADPGTATQLFYGDQLTDVYVSKFSPAGNLIWAKQIKGFNGGYANATGMSIDPKNNITFSGYFTNTVDFDPSTNAYTVSVTGTTDGFICRLDANGDFMWVKTIGGSDADGGTLIHGMALSRKGDVVVTGSFKKSADFNPGAGSYSMTARGNGDAFVCKLDTMGVFVWAQQFGDTSYFDVNTIDDSGLRVATDANDNVYVGGTFESIADFDAGTSTFTMQPSTNKADIFIVKLTTTGNFVWARQLPGSDIEYVNALTASKTGEVYLTGLFEATIDVDPGSNTVLLNTTTLPNSWYDVFLLKLDGNGNYAWHKQLTGDKTKTANGLYVDGNGKVLLTGTFYETVDFDPSSATYTLTATAPTNIYILQLDASGNFLWVNQMGGVFSVLSDMNSGKAITCDASGNIYTVGKFAGTGDMDPTTGTYTLTTSETYPDIFITKLGAVVGLNDYELASDVLQVYPNPTNGQLKIKDVNENQTVTVYNALGSQVLKITSVNNNEFNLGSLPKGVYFIEIANGTNTVTRKIIKE